MIRSFLKELFYQVKKRITMKNLVALVCLLLATGTVSNAQTVNGFRQDQLVQTRSAGTLELWMSEPYDDGTGIYTMDYDLELLNFGLNKSNVREIRFFMKVTEEIQGVGGGPVTTYIDVDCDEYIFCKGNTTTTCTVPSHTGAKEIIIDTPTGICHIDRNGGSHVSRASGTVEGLVGEEMTLGLNQLRPPCEGSPLHWSYTSEGWGGVVTMASGATYDLNIIGTQHSLLEIACSAKKGDVSLEDTGLNMSLFPNPAMDRVQLDIEGDGALELVITNIAGQVIQESVHDVIESQRLFLELDHLEAGVYVVQVSDGVRVKQEKLVVMK